MPTYLLSAHLEESRTLFWIDVMLEALVMAFSPERGVVTICLPARARPRQLGVTRKLARKEYPQRNVIIGRWQTSPSHRDYVYTV